MTSPRLNDHDSLTPQWGDLADQGIPSTRILAGFELFCTELAGEIANESTVAKARRSLPEEVDLSLAYMRARQSAAVSDIEEEYNAALRSKIQAETAANSFHWNEYLRIAWLVVPVLFIVVAALPWVVLLPYLPTWLTWLTGIALLFGLLIASALRVERNSEQITETRKKLDEKVTKLRRADEVLRLTTTKARSVIRSEYSRELSEELEAYAKHFAGSELPQNFRCGWQSSSTVQQRIRAPERELAAIESVLRANRSASIGLSGPRGAGKTTLLDLLCTGEVDNRLPFRYVVRVDAPVVFEIRDFLLHLFGTLCAEVVDQAGEPRGRAVYDQGGKLGAREARKNRSRSRKQMQMATGLLFLLALGSLGLLGWVTWTELIPEARRIPAIDGAVREMQSGIQSLWLSALHSQTPHVVAWMFGGSFLFFALLGTATKVVERRRNLWFTPVDLVRPSTTLFQSTTACLVLSGLDVYLNYNMGLGMTKAQGAALIYALSALNLLRFVKSLAALAMRGLARKRRRVDSRHKEESLSLNELGGYFLRRIRYQQSFTSGWGGKISSTLGAAGGEFSYKGETSSAEEAWTLPEIVHNFRTLLREAAKKGSVLLAIDEMDKISSTDKASELLNDLKAIFQVDRCFYILSISDDAVASFETRGFAMRDAFDSALDEVVQIRQATFEQSQSIMERHAYGIPTVFKALCHALSGGLPRDVIRTLRHLSDIDRPANIGYAAEELCRLELLEKLRTLLRSSPSSTNSRLGPDLVRVAAAGGEVANDFELAEELLQVCDKMLEYLSTTQEVDSSTTELAKVVHQQKAIILLACELLERCRLASEVVSPEDIESIVDIARIRNEINDHPVLAIETLESIQKNRQSATYTGVKPPPPHKGTL